MGLNPPTKDHLWNQPAVASGPISPGPWTWDVDGAHGADSPEWHEVGRLADGNGATILTSDGCENAGVSVLHADARLIAAAPDLLKLALYAASRGEGDSEMAREILAKLGFCVVCRRENTTQTDCSCVEPR